MVNNSSMQTLPHKVYSIIRAGGLDIDLRARQINVVSLRCVGVGYFKNM